jgi:hypothetical protein
LNAFLAPFWNLDQVFGWADTRDPELVRAAALPRYNRPHATLHIAIRSTQSATASMFYGRDIGGELWAASGWKPKIHPFEPPPILARRAEKRGVPAFRLYRYKDLLVDEPFDAKRQQFVDAWKFAAEADRAATAEILRDLERGDISGFDLARLETLPTKLRDDLLAWLLEPETQGPPNVCVREPFPTLKYLEYLFQTGRLTATAQVPGDPRSVQISKLDWSGLKIGVGGHYDRMSVWREGHFRTDGEGDFENVRVGRDEVLREFPAERPEPLIVGPHEANDEEIRAVIREAAAAKGGFLSQDAGAEIVRTRFPQVGRDRARDLVKQVTGNEKRGPKGPRRNSAINSAKPL